MTPLEFVAKWRPVALNERQTAQEHFIDLCRLLREPTPVEADPLGENYAFEKGANRATGGHGWADVWKRGRFAFEYKKRHANLKAALRQLLNYAGALANPPLLIVCDTNCIEIHTNWNDLVSETITLQLEELLDPERLQVLKNAFSNPDALRPTRSRAEVTEEAAREFAALAGRLRQRGHDPLVVAHFVNQILFCMFSQDVGLFEDRLFAKFLRQARRLPEQAENLLRGLFRNMAHGGLYGLDRVDWFNGSLFENDSVLPLLAVDIEALERSAGLNWSAIEPAIFGTLFERGLDPRKRAQLGAHYTDPSMIERIIQATISRPLLVEWADLREEIARLMEAPLPPVVDAPARPRRASTPTLFESLPISGPTEPRRRTTRRLSTPAIEAQSLRDAFLERLRQFRVLDPACGSGNFLYVALRTLKDIELQVIIEAEALGLPRVFPSVGPEAVLGIEKNDYAVELARVTVWIGEIQWMLRKGFDLSRTPILSSLPGIVKADAIFDEDGDCEPSWPDADVIVGNPPFMGSKFHLRRLGNAYTARLRELYAGRVPAGADLVCFWFEKARAMAEEGRVKRVGLLATKSIANAEPSRQVLDRVLAT